MATSFPQPTPYMLAQSVLSGLKIPAIEIDPRNNFVEGAFIFASDIDKMEMTFKSWKEPLRQARDNVVIPSVQKNFQEEGRPKWKALKAQTITNRLYTGFGRGPILERTGRLKNAATRKNVWEITSAVGREGSDMLKLRTTYLDGLAPYAEFHQLGARHFTRMGGGNDYMSGFKTTVTSSGKSSTKNTYKSIADPTSTGGPQLPARPFIQLTLEEETEIYSIFFMFMTVQAEKYWRPESRGGGL